MGDGKGARMIPDFPVSPIPWYLVLRRKISAHVSTDVVSCHSTWLRITCMEDLAREGTTKGPGPFRIVRRGLKGEQHAHRGTGRTPRFSMVAILWNIQHARGLRRYCFCRSVTNTTITAAAAAAATPSSRRVSVVVSPAVGCIIFLHFPQTVPCLLSINPFTIPGG